ncbi:MFS transporter, partial [Mesorhizobium sp. M7A.F.Ca.US.001.04.1.1]
QLLLPLWFVLGLGYSLAQTPSGRLIKRSADPVDRPALFAAQFALSHACWLITYPIAGLVGAAIGLPFTFILLGVIGAGALLAAIWLWPRHDPDVLTHAHEDLPHGHSHLEDAVSTEAGFEHSHGYVVNDRHPKWPKAS